MQAWLSHLIFLNFYQYPRNNAPECTPCFQIIWSKRNHLEQTLYERQIWTGTKAHSTCSRNLKTMIHVCKRSLISNFTIKCRNNLPCDISEAKSSMSDKILASTTTAVTQELATCRKRCHQCLWLVDYHPSLFVNAKNKRSSRTISHRRSIILSIRLAVCYFCSVYLSY